MNLKMSYTQENNQLFKNSAEFTNPKYIRRIFLVFILFYGAFFYADFQYFPDQISLLFIIRFVIVIPILLITILLSFTKSFLKYSQYALAFSFLIGGIGIAYMLILKPEIIMYIGGLFIVLFSGYLLIKLRFIYASLSGNLIILFYIIGFIIKYQEITTTLIFSSFFLVTANIIGMIGSYNIEKSNRILFLNTIKLTDYNLLLQQQYSEKRDQLEQLELSIKENTLLQKVNHEIEMLAHTLKESESRFRRLFELAPFGYQSLDEEGHFLEVNQKWLEIMGYQREEVIGKWFGDFLNPDMKEKFAERFKLFKEKGVIYSEFSMKTKNGDTIFVGFDGIVSYNENGSFLQTHCSVSDISLSKIATEKLLKSEEQYRLLTSEMQLGLALHEIIVDDQGKPTDYRFLSVNEAYEQLTGLKKEDVLGKTVLEVLPNLEHEWIDKYGEVALTGKSIQFESYAREIGKYYSVSSYSPKKGQFAVLVEDITDRILAENELSNKHKDLLTSQKVAKLGTWRLNVKTNEVTWSEELYKMYGFDSTQPIPPYTEHMKLFTKSSWDQLSKALALTSTKGIPYELELEMARKDMTKGWMWVRGEAEYNDQGEIVSLSGAAQDITERKIQEELLRRNEREKSRIISNLPGVSYKCKFDESWTMLFLSDVCETLTGYQSSELIDNKVISYNELIVPKYREFIAKQFNEARRTKKSCNIEYELTRKDGSRIWIWEKGTPYFQDNEWFIEGFFMDITDRKVSEEAITYASNHDYLTNLNNRRYFVEKFNSLISEDRTSIGLIMIDINGLKIINDAYGHVKGDEAIKKVSNLLMKVFNQEGVVARIGGDEFAILLTNKTADDIQIFKDNLVENTKEILIDNVQVSLAIGYELLNDTDKNVDDLLSRAEKQLYRHKVTVGESIRNHAIKAIFNTLTDKYQEEKAHSSKVSFYCKKIGIELGLNKEDVDVLELAGMYHDIGKISIPDAILDKPGKLTEEEFNTIKTHTQIGYQILRAADEYSGLAEYALSHHERWDGRGYPKGLKGDEIPLFSRIINVADSFEAMTTDRPYHKGMSHEDAEIEINRCSGSQFDPKIANLFLGKVLKSIH
ncbi:MAG: hypothetical protein CVU98_11380 [Firmicutes bacterium HGW-Firmicutes-3]|jgi:diguanylate cyclase (GGDEF)-like protein/PAS domain S-box-containing protein/putative nucleotidyltransferase with HDIG domain|nr:MAG: hypothetical protein CVU98_11380 [Firmicutes bacterium HGW-Firmicutes-3]